MDKGEYTGMVLIDLQKAFDTVDHTILLDKLKNMGLDDSARNWFKSYLSERQQVVDVSGTLSSQGDISCGVPQGSILGPLLFLIYVNDMELAVNCKLLLYADDSALLVPGRDVSEIEKRLGTELNSLSTWLVDNKLSLHLGKTESILFGTKKRLRKINKLKINCNGHEVEAHTSVKYLGAELDQSLSGENMGNNVIQKGNSRLKFLYRNGKYLSKHTKKLLASALIQCHFDYSCSMWFSSLSKKTKHRLQTTQNKIIRYVLGLDFRAHIGFSQFKEIGWLPVDTRVAQIKLNHFYRVINNTAPDYLSENVTWVSSSHDHRTRYSTRAVNVPRVNSNGKNSFLYTGSKLWNDLPVKIKNAENLLGFKSATRGWLFNRLEHEENSDFLYY